MPHPTTFRTAAVLLLVSALLLASAAQAEDGATDLGKIDFPTSGSAAAQKHFLRAVMWLHSFEYQDAREAFRAAQKAEPGFAMAHWGEAMTYNHPIWRQENAEEARAALERLAPTPEERLAKALTEREKRYLLAVESLFGEGEKADRDRAYMDAMGELAERFPDDLEAASFHALSILGTSHEGRDFGIYMRAAAVAEEVFDKNPEHPGALHYLIHAYDDPVHAPLGLRPARIYAKVARAAPHALHMPSHVFLALGMWDETASSNEDSWQAALERVEKGGLGVDGKGFHALWWLEYAYLQQGRFDDARELLAIMAADAAASGSRRTRAHLAYLRAHYLVETGRWDEEVASPALDELNPSPVATSLSSDGFQAIHRGDLERAAEILAEMRRRREAEGAEKAFFDGYSRVGEAHSPEAEIMELELEAVVARARGKGEKAVELLEKASRIEEEISSGFGPPIPPKPSHELLGEVLLELGRPAEAKAAFERTLERAPRRALALAGLEKAARALGEERLAAETRAALEQVRQRADTQAKRAAVATIQGSR